MPSINSTVSGLLAKGDAMSKLGGLIGADSDAAQKGVEAATPALLGGLADKASRPGGSQAVEKLLDSGNGGVLDDLGGFLSEAKTEPGNSILDAVFAGERGNVVASLGSQTGLSAGVIGKLLPVLTPIVMGVLNKRKNEDRLDSAGLEKLLTTEKAELTKSGLLGSMTASKVGGAAAETAGKAKGSVGGVAGKGAAAAGAAAAGAAAAGTAAGASVKGGAANVAGGAKSAATGVKGAAGKGAGELTGAAKGVAGKAKSGAAEVKTVLADDDDDGRKGGLGWLIPLLVGLFVLGGIAWWLLSRDTDETSELGIDGAETSVTADAAATPSSVEETPTTPEAEEVDVTKLQADVDSALAGSGVEGITGAVDDEGTVTLTGDVETDQMKADARAAVTNLEGISNIKNEINVGESESAAPAQLECELEGKAEFATGSAELTAAGKTVVDAVAECLAAQPDVNVTIDGYTDTRGDEAANKDLSQRRADSVKTYLVGEKEIAAERLTAVGHGEEVDGLLENPDDTPEKQEANRRIVFNVAP